MRAPDIRLAAAIACLAALACEGKTDSKPDAAGKPAGEIATAAPPAPAPAAKPVATATPTPTATTTKTTTTTTTTTKPRATVEVPAPPVPNAPPPARAEAAATAAVSPHAKVGPAKCKLCHKVEHASWAASAHAAKGLDCESCHGNGGDYWSAAVMKDRAKAAAAGLVAPGVASCKRCHPKADAALLTKAHAHKGQ